MSSEMKETLGLDTRNQIPLSKEETEELLALSKEAIDEELKLVKQKELFDRLIENDDFAEFLSLYCEEEPKRITSVIVSSEKVSAQTISTMQEMLLAIRYFKIFIEAKEAEGNGAELRLEDQLSYREKLENGQILKYEDTEGE